MTPFDYLLVILYLGLMLGIGIYLQKVASRNIDSYFLGERSMPWWALGASGMAGNVDVSGTMINVALIYAIGACGYFIEIRGGIVLIMAFLMAFVGKWYRRAQVMTLAEWMAFRFGKTREGNLARLMMAVVVLLFTVGAITMFAIGAGKFVGEFLGIPPLLGLSSEFWAAAVMIGLATLYTVLSGLQGVVWTDVVQGGFILILILYICGVALAQGPLPETFTISVPMNDGTFQAMSTSKEAWTSIVPKWHLDIDPESQYAIFNLLGLAILFYLLKVFIEGSGGTGGYMAQRYFAAKSDRDAGLLSMFWIILLSFRWPFTVAVAMLGIHYGLNHTVIPDPERVLPVVLREYVPLGLRGLIVAGLMSAAMSTFVSIVNAGAAYWVKDIYQAFINPQADTRLLIRHSRWSSFLIVVLGLAFSLNIQHINQIWGWLTMSIGGGLVIPLFARWYWWRLNGWGFAAGIFAGALAAVVQMAFFPNIAEYIIFAAVSGTSLVAMLVVTWLTPPSRNDVLLHFYQTTRPFGLWQGVRDQLSAAEVASIKRESRRDLLSMLLAVPWQLVLFLTGMTLIMRSWISFYWTLATFVLLSIALYHVWFKHLSQKG
ncbi:sodium:solute symporter [candidate division KSB1 bacterium]|nr:sodium:solute symporter [candidate division KSB1 bacterium]